MDCCQEIRGTQNTDRLMLVGRIFIVLVLLACGVWLAAQTGMRGQGLGYLLIIASPFAILDDTK